MGVALAPARDARLARAAVLARPRAAAIEEHPVSLPHPGEVLIRIEGCGLCGSNVPVWEGRPWFDYPLPPGAPGHEGWGVVEASGEGVALQAGSRVAFLSDRAFAERALVPADRTIPVPEALAGRPAPAEAVGCAMNIFRRSDLAAGQTVAIIGIGFLGALLCRLASDAGARVIAISRRPFALETARRWGADERIPLDDHGEIVARVAELTDGRGCERVIEAIGLQWPLDLASELVAEGGRLVIAGYHQDGPRQVNLQQWNWKGIDVVNAHERDPRVIVEGMRAALEAIGSGRLDPDPLYTHRLPLSRIDEAFETLVARPDGFLKALVVME